MTERYKNFIIGGLIAIVLIMAVGYATFASQLNINGVVSVSTVWNVHFDENKTSGTGVIDTVMGPSGVIAPSGTINFATNTSANLTATLYQPGDSVTFTFTIKNDGTVKANLSNLNITNNGNNWIKFTVGNFSKTTLSSGEAATFTVTASYNDYKEGGTSIQPTDAQSTQSTVITFDATQSA